MPRTAKNKPSVLRWYHHAALICLGLIILSYCGPIRISFPIHGKIVDSETKQPIEGVVVRLSREAICVRMIHGSDRYHQWPLEATTDSAGNFRIGGIWGAAPCLAPRWLYTLTIAAVGYIPAFTDNETDDRLAGLLVFGTYQIKPIRFWLERLNLYEQFKVSPSDNSPFGKTIKAAEAAVTYDMTSSGVFASAKDASFNFVTVKSDVIPDILRQGRWQRHTAIIARDKSRGRFYTWDSYGKEITLDKRNESDNSSLESYVRKLSASGVAPDPPTNCANTDGFFVTISRDSGKRSLVGLAPPKYMYTSQTDSIDLPPDVAVTEIAACAAAANSVYLVLRGQAILRVEFLTLQYKTFKPQVTAFVALKGLTDSLNVSSLAVNTLDWERVRTELGFEVVYAVAGDENVYRFNARLEPDRRIQVVR